MYLIWIVYGYNMDMSKLKPIERELHKFGQIKYLDAMLYSSVRSIQNALPSVSVEKACINFQDTFNITEEQWSIDNMKVTYHRLHEIIIKTSLWHK